MCQPDSHAAESLTHAELLLVLAWVIGCYCGTGVVEIGPSERDEASDITLTITRHGDVLRIAMGELKR